MSKRAFITGISGLELSAAEREFIRAERPWGFILFKRNIETSAQVALLVRELRAVANDAEAPVLIDQEGGRVQRLGPPNWPVYPAGAVFGALYDVDPTLGLTAARLSGRLIADDLTELGVTVDCLPLADVPVEGADAVIGDRAYGTEATKVAAIARAVTEGLEQGGVLPVLKHIPGHGRATADTHFRLPEVDASQEELQRTDFAAFRALADLPMAMTAHVVFSALDPAHPATTSATIVRQVIRGVIGFQGLLMSDDVSMNALMGSIAERTRAAITAGCDVVLHCNGNLDEMREVARETPELSAKALERANRALASRKAPLPFDRKAARARLDALIDRAKFYRLKLADQPNSPMASRRWSLTSKAMRARSICCWRWRGNRKSTLPRSRSWHSPISIWRSLKRPRRYGWNWRPTISSWRHGWHSSSRGCCCQNPQRPTGRAQRKWQRRSPIGCAGSKLFARRRTG